MNKSHLMGALYAAVFSFITTTTFAVGVSGQGTWETTLQSRDLDGNSSTIEAYYDTDLDITWLADANYAGTGMDWTTANSWAAGLYGNAGWRLPYTNPVNGANYNYDFSYQGTTDDGFNISAPGTTYAGSTGSEMAHLFHNTLGDIGYCGPSNTTEFTCTGRQDGYGLTNTGPFSNIQSYFYWSATEYAPITDVAWLFGFDSGDQTTGGKEFLFYVWAVHDGDVGAAVVPLPTAILLFCSGLLGLIGISRRKKAA